jgi:hypothetical protein
VIHLGSRTATAEGASSTQTASCRARLDDVHRRRGA